PSLPCDCSLRATVVPHARFFFPEDGSACLSTRKSPPHSDRQRLLIVLPPCGASVRPRLPPACTTPHSSTTRAVWPWSPRSAAQPATTSSQRRLKRYATWSTGARSALTRGLGTAPASSRR